MRLNEFDSQFRTSAPTFLGWASLWSAFVDFVAEPLEESGVLEDNAIIESLPPDPPYTTRHNVLLIRSVALRSDPNLINSLEASLRISAYWDLAGPPMSFWSLTGQAASAREHDPAVPLNGFIHAVENHVDIQTLSSHDPEFGGCTATYLAPEEAD